MGDFFKKNFILIVFILITILRLFNTSKVFGSEFVYVSPVSDDGSYSVQTDNQHLTLQENQKTIQGQIIGQLWWLYDNGYKDNVRYTVNDIRQYMTNKKLTGYTSYLWFGVNTSGEYYYEYTHSGYLKTDNVQVMDAELNRGYKMFSVPFFVYTRYGNAGIKTINKSDGTISNVEGQGVAKLPCAEVGCYSERWLDLFEHCELLESTAEYETLLSDIENNQQLMLQQDQVQSAIQRDTNQVVTNTYNYINDKNVEDITSLGFSSPDVEEKIDLNDVFDQFEALLTDENYHPKQFSFWLPNGDETVFSISPTMLEDNLTRVGGSYIVQIIHAIWFISLYGWYIFAYFGILGKLISGDWFHLVRGQSPVTRMVKFSVGSITGNARF